MFHLVPTLEEKDTTFCPGLKVEDDVIVITPSIVEDDGFEIVKNEDALLSAPPAPPTLPTPRASTESKRKLSDDKVGLENLVLLLAFDTTASMSKPINTYGKLAALAVISILKSSVREHFGKVHVEVHIVGLNDWNSDYHGTKSQPCRLFANRAVASESAGKPVGLEFDIDADDEKQTDQHVGVLQEAIEEVAQYAKHGKECGGDLAEEYGVGIDLLTHIVADAKSRYPQNTTRYFAKILTDAATHGIAHPKEDMFKKGVTEEAVYGGLNCPWAHSYSCAYAPYKVHGFRCWKPVSLLDALNKLLDQKVMVAWVAIGDSASQERYQHYKNWLGTLAAILEGHDNGFLIRWDSERACAESRKRESEGTSDVYSIGVPGVIRHIFTSVLTSASAQAMAATVSDARKTEGLKAFFEEQDRAYVASLPPSSQAATASIEDHGQTVQQCEVSSDLTGGMHKLFMRGLSSALPDALDSDMTFGAALDGEEAQELSSATFASVRTVQESKGSCKDYAAAMAYHTLSFEPEIADVPTPFFRKSMTAPTVEEEMASGGFVPPLYRSLSNRHPYVADYDAPCYRGMAVSILGKSDGTPMAPPVLAPRKYGSDDGPPRLGRSNYSCEPVDADVADVPLGTRKYGTADGPPRLGRRKASGTERLIGAAASLMP